MLKVCFNTLIHSKYIATQGHLELYPYNLVICLLKKKKCLTLDVTITICIVVLENKITNSSGDYY